MMLRRTCQHNQQRCREAAPQTPSSSRAPMQLDMRLDRVDCEASFSRCTVLARVSEQLLKVLHGSGAAGLSH